GRIGLVATNSICQGKNRKSSLDYIIENDGHIYNAISSQVWSGEAAVYVSIVNWCKISVKSCFLDGKFVPQINSSLTSLVDISKAVKLSANLKKSFVGVQPNSQGFFISQTLADEWIKQNNLNLNVIKRSISATDLTDNPNGEPSRWIIDFQNMSLEEITDYYLPFEHLKIHVKPERQNNREAVLREKWWRFKRTNEAMRKALGKLSICFIVPRHSKWFIFLPMTTNGLPADSTTVVASDDYYILG
ncbi:MAG: class I SAM-dependent DNA methyltransferase, partial [Planktothrix sp.]